MASSVVVDPLRFVTPVQIEHSYIVLRWLEDYISRPHAELGREGSVCPFVPPALERNSVYVALHEEIAGDPDSIEQLLICYIPVFSDYPPRTDPEKIYKTFLVVFPNIPSAETTVLDGIHARVKTTFVENGLMLGQFHPNCPEPAARNPFFRVSLSPIPLVAIRHMALHDILFLGENEGWFQAYVDRFGFRYDRKMVASDLYIRLFNQAKERFPLVAARSIA